MSKYKYLKKPFLMAIVFYMVFISVFSSYKQSVKAADVVLVGGYVALKELLTAILVGGGVVATAYGMDCLMNASDEDVYRFKKAVQDGFEDYCVERAERDWENINSQITTTQTATEYAKNVSSDFFNKALTSGKSTVKNVSLTAMNWWQEYCSILNDCYSGEFDSSGNSGDLGFNVENVVNPNYVKKLEGYTMSGGNVTMPKLNKTFKGYSNMGYAYQCDMVVISYAGDWYVNQYNVYNHVYCFNNSFNPVSHDSNLIATHVSIDSLDFISEIPVVMAKKDVNGWFDDSNWSNGEVWNIAKSYCQNYVTPIENDDLPTAFRWLNDLRGNNDIVDHAFSNAGDVPDIIDFKNDIWVRKKSITDAQSGGYSGSIGWDIPGADLWQKYLNGEISLQELLSLLGALGIPKDKVGVGEREGTISIPGDTVVDYPKDYSLDTPHDYDEPYEGEGEGSFEGYKENLNITAIPLSELFPFCIPFDIILLFQKLVPDKTTAPTFEMNFEFSRFGLQDYTYVFDFADFIILSTVLRDMLTLLFIYGLMVVTRSIIRG